MNTHAKSHRAPQPVAAGALSQEAQHLVLCRSGRQSVFALMGCASKKLLTRQLGTFATFVFPLGPRPCGCADDTLENTPLHSQIVCDQTRKLSRHVETFERVFVISNLYSHPLVKPGDILDGHRLVSFAGMPIRNTSGKIIGTVCTVDTKARRWNDTEIKALKEIALQIEDSQLS